MKKTRKRINTARIASSENYHEVRKQYIKNIYEAHENNKNMICNLEISDLYLFEENLKNQIKNFKNKKYA